MTLIKIMQRNCFTNEIHNLNQRIPIRKVSPLYNLDPFVDEDNLVRVGGGLNNAGLVFDQEHQIILAANHPLTKLIIIQSHNKLFHAGPLSTLYELRNRYWPLKAKSTIKNIIHVTPCNSVGEIFKK